MRKLIFLIFISFISFDIQAALPDAVWRALEKQDRKLARTLLEAALKTEETKVDAAMTLALLNLLEAKRDNLDLMKMALPAMEDPSSYLFALWFSDAVVDGLGKKDKAHEQFLEMLIKNTNLNESIRASATYTLGFQRLLSNDYKSAWKTWAGVQSLKDWQFVGPFDNISGSGFNKNFDPIQQPQPQASFKSATNSNINWFTPNDIKMDPWLSPIYYVPVSQGVVFAQTFVISPDDRTVILASGYSGDCKLWVNDQQVLELEEELKTELDYFKRSVRLKKGANRILIQLGFTYKTDYPNFIVRLLDENMKPAQGLTHSSIYQPYNKASKDDFGDPVPHFAEAFFEKKIKEQPTNILNYLMLSKVYYRSGENNKAIEVLHRAEKLSPNNILVHQALIENYSIIGNRTEILKQLEHIRTLDASLPMIVVYDLEQHLENENYDDAAKQLEQLKMLTGDDSENFFNYQIRLYGAKKDYAALLECIEKAYNKYPENPDYAIYNYRIAKNTSQQATLPAYQLEEYLKNNFNDVVFQTLIDEYIRLGNKPKVENLLKKRIEMFSEELSFISALAGFYFQLKNYTKALEYTDMKLKNAPFYAEAWLEKGYIKEVMKRKQEAIADFEKAIHYDPNLFDAREKLRELQGKEPLLSYFKKDDAYDIIQKQLQSALSTDDNYEYIFDERNFVAFAEGASVEYNLLSIRMLNESGVQNWKETSIGYNGARQRLVIEKAETIKKNGQKIAAEQNGNEIVFPSLEVGDAILIIYKNENYTSGKLSKEFWDSRIFNDFAPVKAAVYRLLVPVGFEYNMDSRNIDVQPVETDLGDFTMKTWKFENLSKSKDEVLMPPLGEVGMSLQLTSVDSWRIISEWYHDLALPLGRENFNINRVYEEIFSGKNIESDFEKARVIYDYLCQNIRYSSVSFRQSNFVPQKPMTTISTQLGDCKDLSLLYHVLAKKAGLHTHLVLVNTRDNGENTLRTPSLNFNHCIVKIDLKDQTLFQELTSEKLPFGAVPNTIANAQALVIPNSKDDPEGAALIHIPSKPVHPTHLIRKTTVKINSKDLQVKTSLTTTGNSASEYRYHFSGLTKERIDETMENLVAQPFKNHLQLGTYSFEKLESRDPSFTYHVDFEVENEVMLIGGMKAAKLPFFETIFSLSNFPNEERVYPIQYWLYETADFYETEIIYQLPEGSEIVEIPEDVAINDDYIQYSLQSEKLNGNSVKVLRKVTTKKNTIPAEQYKHFRETVKKIIEAEDKYLVFR
ncbi:MAG: DUF3857 domain-containing protein [Saprospiraceae bacterium]